MADSRAECTWHGNLAKGNGTVRVQSGAFGPLPVTWEGRTQRPQGATSPEEFIAAAVASCWCMALSHGLAEKGHTAEELDATCDVHFESGKITDAKVRIRGRVPGVTQQQFEEIAKGGCPVSRALTGTNVTLESATLQS